MPVTQSVVLSVDSPRELGARIVKTDSDVTMSLGSPAKMYCLAYGFPKPTVTWWKGTTILDQSSDRHRLDDFTLSLRWAGTSLAPSVNTQLGHRVDTHVYSLRF